MRCGKCKNCVELEKVRQRVLACVNPPFSHADDDVVAVWNSELTRLPCEHAVAQSPAEILDKKYPGLSMGCLVDRPVCSLCSSEDFVEADAGGDHFCGDCQSIHQIRTIPDSVCGPVDRFPLRGSVPIIKTKFGSEP